LLVAVPLAALGANAFTNFFAEFSNFDIMSRGVPWIVLLIEIIIALLVPILAATIPVNTAMRLTVREAIADSGLSASDTQSFVDKLALSLQGGPVALALALRNTFRRKSRLMLTLGTLTLAGAIFISVLSVRDALFGTFDRALAYYGYDLSIDLGGTYRIEQIQREAARESGVVATEGWFQRSGARIRPDGSESANYSVIGVPLDTQFIVPELRSGTWVNENVRNGIVVNTDFSSDEQDVQVGDILTLKIGSKETEWTVIGICTTQYSQPVLYANIDDLGRAVGQVGYANRALVKLTSNEEEFQSGVARNLEERFKRAGLLVGSTTTRSEFVETFSFRFDFLIIFLLMLAVLLAFVGGLGLAGTMGLNVLERIREIGVLRAVGAASKSVERIVLAEGLVIGGISWIVAVVLAVPLAYGMSTGVGLAFGGEPLVFTYSIVGAVIWLALVMGIATVSSYAPARRASSITVREVLAYE
ncbi:MAG: ABC transporter permease, partial [Anaerolineae bacterium]|nr:ABC transporter permease [Anaerolineae bacterium]